MKLLYPLLWRWHFIIGLLAAPVLISVSITGALYAFEPQLERVFEPFQTYAPCDDCERLPYSVLTGTGHAQRPEWHLHALFDPGNGRSIQVHLEDPAGEKEDLAVFLDPHTGEVLHQRSADEGIFTFILRLHRTLLAGEFGRNITEIMISWIFVTLFLGFTLWWPRRNKGGGGWWPRLRSKGRRFWRDLHSVIGFYLLPIFLLIGFTGLFFSPWANYTILAGMFAADQLPDIYISPPKVENPPANAERLGIDGIIDDFLARNDVEHFDVHYPEAPEDAYVLSAHIGFDVWKLRQAHYNPYNGQLLGEARWEDLKPGAQALMLFFPLHTGSIFGLGTQIIAFVAALLMVFISIAGIVMWWLRRKPGEIGLPELGDNPQRPGWKGWLLIAVLGLMLPAFGASLLVIFAYSGLRRFKRRQFSEEPSPAEEAV